MVRHQRRAVTPAAVASVLFVPITVVAALADARFGPRAATCRTAASPVLAARTPPDVRAALSFPLAVDPADAAAADPAVAYDEDSGLWCAPAHAHRAPHAPDAGHAHPGGYGPPDTDAGTADGPAITAITAITAIAPVAGATALPRPLSVERVLRRAARELGRRLARF